MSTNMPLAYGAASAAGPRPVNEDRPATPELTIPDVWQPAMAAQRGLLVAVADGVGGQAAGEVASAAAARALMLAYYTGALTDAETMLRAAVRQAAAAVYDESLRSGEGRGMGSTLVAALVVGDQLLVANVGDSRAYLVRSSAARQMTQDHSLVAEQLRTGLIDEEQARRHSMRNIITRSLGGKPIVEPDVFHETLLPGDAVVLCSDGVWGVLPDQEIARLAVGAPPAVSAQHLVERAVGRNSQDNCTAVVLAMAVPAAQGGADRAVPWLPIAGGVFLAVAIFIVALAQPRHAPLPGIATTTTRAATATVVSAVPATATPLVMARPATPTPPLLEGAATPPATSPSTTSTTAPAPTVIATSTVAPTVTATPSATSTPPPTATRPPSPTEVTITVLSSDFSLDRQRGTNHWHGERRGGLDGGPFGWTWTIGKQGNSTLTGHWRFSVAVAGTYDIAVYIPRFAQASRQARYTVMQGGRSLGSSVQSQEVKVGQWLSLGSYELAAGEKVILTLSDWTSELYYWWWPKSQENRRVLFDAARLKWVGP